MESYSAVAKALWVHDLSPVLIAFGSVQIRYYGLLFAGALLTGYHFWRKQALRGGYSDDAADAFFWLGVAGVVIGSRLGHVLFYEPERFLSDPLEILKIWHGGLASHGATIGLLLALWYYSRRYKMPMLEASDRLSLSVAFGASFVRAGNFFNSEIVGRATDVPWAIVFNRYDRMIGLPPTPRHPSQIYEFLQCQFVFLLLYLFDRKFGEKRPRGMMAGIFLAGYFTTRFLVEFFKESQGIDDNWTVTMGQVLSVPFAVAGFVLIFTRMKAARKVLAKIRQDESDD